LESSGRTGSVPAGRREPGFGSPVPASAGAPAGHKRAFAQWTLRVSGM